MHIKDLLKGVTKDQTLFLCIGTPKIIGDALGPITGTFLKLKGYKVFGTEREPVHALNLQKYIQLINVSYNNYKVIAIDAACTYSKERVGLIKVGEGGLTPGEGIRKDLPTVGDIHILGLTMCVSDDVFTALYNANGWMVERMALDIVRMIDNSFINVA